MLDLSLESGIMKLSTREKHQKKTERRKRKMKQFTFENYLKFCEINNIKPQQYKNLQNFKLVCEILSIIQ